MKNRDREKREYDYCLKRFSKYGFDIRESLAEEWFSQKEEDQAQKDAEKYISEGGIFVPCVNCGNMFYVTSKEIQKVRDRKAKRPELCENCNEQANTDGKPESRRPDVIIIPTRFLMIVYTIVATRTSLNG